MKINSNPVSFCGIRVPISCGSQKDLRFTMEMLDVAERLFHPQVECINSYKALFFENKLVEQNIKSELDKYKVTYIQSVAIDAYSNSAKQMWTRTGNIPY